MSEFPCFSKDSKRSAKIRNPYLFAGFPLCFPCFSKDFKRSAKIRTLFFLPCVFPSYPRICFFERFFPSFAGILGVQHREKILAFFGWFSLLSFQKKQGKEDQGRVLWEAVCLWVWDVEHLDFPSIHARPSALVAGPPQERLPRHPSLTMSSQSPTLKWECFWLLELTFG